MAGRGGGRAEDFARFKQYDYKANSNLVLTAEQRTSAGREPDGSAESLWGKMKSSKMGDRVQRERPDGLAKKPAKKREGAPGEEGFDLPKRRKGTASGMSVLDIDTAGMYRPRTKETREAYEALLSVIREQFGDQPADILRGAADEVLSTLKNDRINDPSRHKEVDALLGAVADEKFAQLVALGKLITDYSSPEEAALAAAEGEGALDEDIGVAVEFEDEEEDEEEEEMREIVDDDEEEEGEEEERGGVRTGGADVDAGEEAGDDGIPVQEIDAYWLQRRVTRAFGDIDPTQAQTLAEDAYMALELPDHREVENKLVGLLGFDHFELIKELLKNRLRIVWCQRLARAEDEEARQRIETEMEASPETRAILDALHATRASARERQSAVERSIREEARRLRQGQGGEGGGAGGAAAAGRKAVDLDNLSFHQGSHFNSSKQCTLPQGSYRTVHKGYEEVHVPALKPKPFTDGEQLVDITALPEWAQPGFKGMKALNRIQSRVCDCALYSSENMLVCAPTGAGKTNVAMLTMLHEIGLHRRDDGSIDTAAFKIIYVAPMKALVAEMVGNFGKRLEPYGVKVRELTGDMSMTKQEIDQTQVIIVTPEKWDIITRKSGDRTYTQLVRLVIIDEIHLLHDDRGAVLESIVARTVRQIETTQEMVRLVGLSATLPNFEDVAAFLRVKPEKGLFYFDNSFRPCPLAQQYIGVTVKKPLQRFQLMNEICYSKVMEAAGKHQTLIFVHSRKETAKTARYLKEEALKHDTLAKILRDDSASREILQTEAEGVKNADLRELLPYGFGIHHAGMARADRTLVEDLFADGHIQVLVSTATLAWGVNLPAHTVIIKGTQVYNPVKSAWMELSPLDVMQMFGRAGRPQFDTFGEGIIITSHSELQFYLSLFNMQLPIESQYVRTIADNLNAEVVLGTVANIRDAASWLGYTYLYVRMLCNPQLYGVPIDAVDSDPLLQERRLDLAHTAATILDKNNLVKYDRRSGALQPTDLGRIASQYYVSYRTISSFNDHLKPTMGEIELLRLFALADEFKYMIVREEEKLELAKLIERVPIPVKESLDEPTAKINVLLQAYISQLKLEGLALTSDMVYVTQSAGRLMRCLFEVCMRRGWAGLTDKALMLSKCVMRRMWGSQTPLRQFKGIPYEILSKIEKKDLAWDRWYDLNSQEIGELIRFPKMGKTVHRLVHQFPRLELSAHVQPITRTVLKVDLTITPDFQWEDKIHGGVEPFWILVEDSDSEQVLHHEYFLLKSQLADEDSLVTFTLPVAEPLPPQYFIRVVSDKWLGCESVLPVSFRHLILPEKYAPPTELLDLQPLPVSALRNPEFEGLYKQFTHFNPIQTQVFTALYNTDDSALVAAPTGSGKTICAEFALLRMIQRASEGKCTARAVYVAPLESLAEERYADWSVRFGGGLGLSVVQLTGEAQADIKLLDKGNIIVATPEQWDMLSRRWKQRKAVQDVPLFIVDELHLLGGTHGPALEVITSRMRYLSSQLDKPVRIVALSSSLANAKDVGEWIGATQHGMFNFPPGVRPVPLEIHIQGFDIVNLEARMQAMLRPAYAAIGQHARDGQPAIVFVPTRKHAKMAALDLLTHAAADGAPHKFRQAEEADIAPYLDRVGDPALKHSLSYGVAFLHETQNEEEQRVARLLFESGAVQVLVATAPMCWGLSAAAHLVVIMGTQYYDVTGQGTNDYPVTDLLQMMGRASRPLQDEQGICVLQCHAPKKEYYKKFLFEPLPVESHLDHFLHDHMAAEVVTRTITNKQDAVDYLTWTFYYRRLTKNPNYYNLTGTSHRHVSDHLSELVESILADLEQSKLLSIEDDMDLEPLNLGMIAAYYYIAYTTIELFASSLTAKTKLKGLLDILSSASEYDDLPVRPGEERVFQKLLQHAPLAVDRPKYTDPHTKVNALVQAHLSRTALNPDMGADARRVVGQATRLLQAMVDVISSSGWLNPALAAMEMSQMVTQGLWQRDPVLMQLPHVTRELAAACAEKGVETVFDLMEMEDDARRELLQMSEQQLEDVARWCNRYPDINVAHQLADADNVRAGEPVSLTVQLEREGEGEPRPVDAPRYPGRKDENWWLVVGDTAGNGLLAIKRVTLQRKAKVRLDFVAPKSVGTSTLTLFFMCDSYMGCDQEFEIELDVKEGAEGGDEEQAMDQD
ncbi:U5 small nuclear ribonucleo 200 kDa helicase-like [Micractinium conductrix]|uniref:RNA helicase n=1 Tax=Micractinium conductrix TaxID=554055 RepID=A0A2P6V4J1_9CHLO|nr:U5 small nuclear ribonucleo 200 kDa helicase-like [Micractinium conductrix]|eukprot:PSC69011.1 U5 small nuclear ribonucleo 200 kDa helicase-like [Micractinium conductrix]